MRGSDIEDSIISDNVVSSDFHDGIIIRADGKIVAFEPRGTLLRLAVQTSSKL